MNYVEMTTEEAIKVLRKSKGKKVLVAIKDLENDDDDAIFYQKLKSDCESMIQEAQTVSSMCDEFVKKLDLFTEKQRDLFNIKPIGLKKTILLRE
jgi:transcription initiation factor IIF auxiliary subunit